MSGLDAGVVGEWLADADDAPIPIPWRGQVYYAQPPDGDRGKRIVALSALSKGEATPSDDVEETDAADDSADQGGALDAILQGEPLEVLTIGRETYEALIDAGMRADGEAMRRVSTLCLIRWAYGSDEIARNYLANFGRPAEPESGTPTPPKSRARSGQKTSRSTGSASRTRSRAGSRTTSSPKE